MSSMFQNYGMTNPNQYNNSQYFPQSQGNVYTVNNSMEVANIPVIANISAILCPNESLLYLKSMQNGAPALMAYKLTPYEIPNQGKQENNTELKNEIAQLKQQIAQIQKSLGGKINELI